MPMTKVIQWGTTDHITTAIYIHGCGYMISGTVENMLLLFSLVC